MNLWTKNYLAVEAFTEEYLHNIPTTEDRERDSIVLVQGKNIYGEKVYCYLKVDATMFYEVKQKLLAKEKFDLRDYGEVIAAGSWGPSFEEQMDLDREYNMLPFDKQDN